MGIKTKRGVGFSKESGFIVFTIVVALEAFVLKGSEEESLRCFLVEVRMAHNKVKLAKLAWGAKMFLL